MIKSYSKFIAWWVSVLLILTGIFWANYFGFVYKIWESDVTMITSLISIVFVLTNIPLGWLSYNLSNSSYKQNPNTAKILDMCWFVSEQLMALGMLGTVIGLIHMLAANFIGINNDAGMQTLLSDMWKSMGLALYTNAVGLIFSIVLKVQVYFIGQGLDET